MLRVIVLFEIYMITVIHEARFKKIKGCLMNIVLLNAKKSFKV